MDTAEWKETYEKYCAWFMPRMLALRGIIEAKANNKSALLVKFYAYDTAIDTIVKEIGSKYKSLNFLTTAASRNTNAEVYLYFTGYSRIANEKHDYNQLYSLIERHVAAKIDKFYINGYEFRVPIIIKSPPIDFTNKIVTSTIPKDLPPPNHEIAYNHLEKVYGFEEINEQPYNRFRVLKTLKLSLDASNGSYIERPMHRIFIHMTLVYQFFKKTLDWSVTKVTPFHTFVTTITKYDTVPDISNFPEKDFADAMKFVQKKIFKDKKFKRRTFEQTKEKILAGESKNSSPGHFDKRYGTTVAQLINSEGFEDKVNDAIAMIDTGIYPMCAFVNVMGKFERKKFNQSKDMYGNVKKRRADSRLVFYTECTFRFIEEMIFGEMLDFSIDPVNNKFAMGHNKYSDYGDIMHSRSKSKAFSIGRDIAGWDTRFHDFIKTKKLQLNECKMYLWFIARLNVQKYV